jgi:multidrug transporter EmrE-like cation transporter
MSSNWRAGLALSLATAALWGFLPIVVKGVLKEFDPFTTTWYRFLGGSLLLGLWLLLRRPESLIPPAKGRAAGLLALAILCMSGNFTLFVLSLSYQSPSVAQTVLQLGPTLVFLGGAFLFKEPLGRGQWLGFATLLGGLGFFFNEKLPLLFASMGPQSVGVLLITLSAGCFACYSLTQKSLIGTVRPETTLFWALLWRSRAAGAAGETGDTPARQPDRLAAAPPRHPPHVAALLPLRRGAARMGRLAVGAIVATPPLVTVFATDLIARLIPDYINRKGSTRSPIWRRVGSRRLHARSPRQTQEESRAAA